MIPFDRLHTISYSSSIVNMSLSSTVSEIFSVVRGCSRSLKMVPINRPHRTLYWSAVVTISLSCTIFELFDVQNIVTLKSMLGVIENHWKWHYSIDGTQFPIHLSLQLWPYLVRTIFELKRDIGLKTPIFHTPLYLTCTISQNPFEFLPKILIQTVRVPELLGGAKILPKSSSICLVCNNITDDRRQTDSRQTDGSCHKSNVTQ